jgi:hypothetical protein
MMPHGVPSWRRSFPYLVLISLVASLLAACGGSSSGVITGTVTPLTTATPTPAPCVTWRIIPSPELTQTPPIYLSGVSAAAPTDVWAVGRAKNSSTTQDALIEHWDGTMWRLVSSPPTDDLRGVAAITPSDVWAVGVVDVSGNAERPLMEHWNGTAWQATAGSVPKETTLGAFGHLDAVTTIPGTNQLWAVGDVGAPSPTTGSEVGQALIEQWDGTAWHIIATPPLPAEAVQSALSGVVALSPTDAWAVGSYTGSDGKARPLILRWDGTAWQVVSGAAVQGGLSGVAAAGVYDVRAVGTDGTTGQALIEQWDGAAWHVVASPTPSGATKSALRSVTADSAGNFWAVGSSQNAAGTSQTLIERCP